MVLRWSGDFHDIISITNPTSCYFSRRRFSRHFRSVKQVILLMNIVISRQLISRQTKHQVPWNLPYLRWKKSKKAKKCLVYRWKTCTGKTAEIRQKKAKIQGSSGLYCLRQKSVSSRKLSQFRQQSVWKQNLFCQVIFVKEESGVLYMWGFHFFIVIGNVLITLPVCPTLRP